MPIRIGRRFPSSFASRADPFSDLLFNSLLGISLLFFVAILFVNPRTKAGDVDYKAYFVITVTWADGSPDDVDIWVEDPLSNKLWFRQREVGLLHLDRDDRGMEDDQLQAASEVVESALNQEVVTIRGVVPGRYTVNLHYYKSNSGKPVAAVVRIFKLRPDYRVIVDKSLVLEREGAERTVANIKLGLDGEVKTVDQVPRRLVFSQ